MSIYEYNEWSPVCEVVPCFHHQKKTRVVPQEAGKKKLHQVVVSTTTHPGNSRPYDQGLWTIGFP